MIKNISLTFGALMVAMTLFSLAVPQKAEAFQCVLTEIPPGYTPTTTPCGQPGCSGFYYKNRGGSSLKCIIMDNGF